jgi:hypothetical protein
MNCAERIDAVFSGDMADTVPFALKGWRIPQCEAERELRNAGLCVIDSRSVYSSSSPNTETDVLHFTRQGVSYQKRTVRTPVGVLTSLTREVATDQTERTTWRVEMPFKTPQDYDAVEFMIRDRIHVPAYDTFLKAQRQMGGDAFFKTSTPGAPIHTIMYEIMGLETFSIEWAERRDRVLALNDAIAENQREIFAIVAKSPAHVVQCGGNYAAEVLGRERLIELVLPHWEEVCDVLHVGGKMVGSHLDANNRLWAKEIGNSKLDWIEAFTPAPDTDMSMADARKMWPGKVLFINFPSSLHLESVPTIESATKQILLESAPGDRLIIGITENVPENRWRESFRAILETARIHGKLPLG